VVRPLAGHAEAAVFDAATASLAVLSPGIGGQSMVTVVPPSGAVRPVPLPGPTTAITGDNAGRVYASTRGGYFRVDMRAGTATRVDVEGQPSADFTAITRRADGKLWTIRIRPGIYFADDPAFAWQRLRSRRIRDIGRVEVWALERAEEHVPEPGP